MQFSRELAYGHSEVRKFVYYVLYLIKGRFSLTLTSVYDTYMLSNISTFNVGVSTISACTLKHSVLLSSVRMAWCLFVGRDGESTYWISMISITKNVWLLCLTIAIITDSLLAIVVYT